MNDNTDYLITLVKQKETIPNSGSAYADTVLLNYLDQSMKGFITPAIESVIEEHFVVTIDTLMPELPNYNSSSPPVNVSNVLQIPSESSGYRLRDVYIIGSDGTPHNLMRMTPTQAASNQWNTNGLFGINNVWYGGFYLQGNTVQLFPYGIASNKLVRMTYRRSPADLALVADSGKVTSVVGDVVTIDTVQPTWFSGITSVAVSSKSLPHDYVTNPTIPTTVYTSPAVLSDVLLVAVAGNILTFPAGVAGNIQVGDYVSLAGSSVFAQNIPKQLYPALVQKAAAMSIHAAGDSTGQAIAEKQFDEMMKMAMKQIAHRVEGKPITLIPVNSAFRASRGATWGRF